MDRREAEKKYKKLGLKTIHASDKPHKVYEPHKHHATWLYCLKGSVKVKLDGGSWKTIKSGDEIIIKEDQLHEAVVGPDGWEYIFAYPTNEEPFSYEPPQT